MVNTLQKASQQNYANASDQWDQYLQRMRQRPDANVIANTLEPIVNQVAPRPAPRPAPTPMNPRPGSSGAQLGGVGQAPRGSTRSNAAWREYPNSFWNSVPQATLKEFSENQESVARLWAKKHGYGERTQQVLNSWSDPVAVLHGIGQGGHMLNDIPAKLDLTGQMYDRVLGVGDRQNQYIDPRDITRRVVAARVQIDPRTGAQTSTTDPMADVIAGPSRTPEEQVSNTIQFLGASLRGLLPEATYRSYLGVLRQQGEEFLLHKMRNPTLSGTFNRWIGDRMGPDGGL